MTDFEKYKLIHEFVYPDEPLKSWVDEANYIDTFKRDWNVLIPVVSNLNIIAGQHIMSLDVKENTKDLMQDTKDLEEVFGSITAAVCTNTIEEVYESVVLLIQWCNQRDLS